MIPVWEHAPQQQLHPVCARCRRPLNDHSKAEQELARLGVQVAWPCPDILDPATSGLLNPRSLG
jgi:hypothetical protein